MNSFELFSGGGGLVLGMAKAGFHHLGLVELNKNACATLRLNQKLGSKALAEAEIFEGDACATNYKPFVGKVDVVAGGPPCQPFSLGGKHKGHKDSRDMFPQAVRAVRELAPKAFIFENVKGLTRPIFKDYLSYIHLQLSFPEIVAGPNHSWEDHYCLLQSFSKETIRTNLSYNVSSILVNAANYGVPQKRERIFLVGFRTDLGIQWKPPLPTHSEESLMWEKFVTQAYWHKHAVSDCDIKKSLKDFTKISEKLQKKEKPHLAPWRTVRDAFMGLPHPYTDDVKNPQFKNHEFRDGARSYPGHTGSPYDEPSKALKAGDHGVPGGENMLAYPNGKVRYFSVRESARIQTFPDNYLFEGSWGEVMRQLGNAVPAHLAEIMANSVINQLTSVERKVRQNACFDEAMSVSL